MISFIVFRHKSTITESTGTGSSVGHIHYKIQEYTSFDFWDQSHKICCNMFGKNIHRSCDRDFGKDIPEVLVIIS